MNKELMALISVGMLLALGSPGDAAKQEKAANFPKTKEFRIERSMSPQAMACIECHKTETPGLFVDWSKSRHASANITCLDCHQAEPSDKDVSQEHFKQYERTDNPWGKAEYRTPVATVVTPTAHGPRGRDEQANREPRPRCRR